MRGARCRAEHDAGRNTLEKGTCRNFTGIGSMSKR